MKAILREILSDGDTLSWGRVGSLGALIAVVWWGSIIVFKTHSMPPLDGATAFVTGPYVASKAATAVQAFSRNPSERDGK
jgi:hypothetical protein